MSLKVTKAEREAFLADVHVGVISLAAADRGPLTVPIWYSYHPENGLWIVTARDSQKALLLQAAGRFSLCAQSEQPPYKYVSVEGAIASVRPADLDQDFRPLAYRYLDKKLGDQFMSELVNTDNLIFTMLPERWLTVDYAKQYPVVELK